MTAWDQSGKKEPLLRVFPPDDRTLSVIKTNMKKEAGAFAPGLFFMQFKQID